MHSSARILDTGVLATTLKGYRALRSPGEKAEQNFEKYARMFPTLAGLHSNCPTLITFYCFSHF